VASYHLDVKSVQRSAGRSATAAAAYRHACRIDCEREGRTHDYTRKAGVEASLLVLPAHAPAWAEDREALWNAAEARDTRVNSVTAREWEVALPHELDQAGRRALVEGFARELVARYGVAADVAIHAPHREGDKRNWHAHVMTTTRVLSPAGLAEKTRALDAQATRGAEVTHMRERWAALQNEALERHGHEARVDHRSLEAQREAALAHGDELAADTLDRAPEVKLGPVVSGIERREERAAEREHREYAPVTERGAQVHEAREVRGLLAELVEVRAALRRQVQERAALARDAYQVAREEGTDRVRAGLAALRAAAQRQGIGPGLGHEAGPSRSRDEEDRHGQEASAQSIKERLARLLGREAPHHAQDGPVADLPGHSGQSHGVDPIRERLDALRARPSARREEHGRARQAPDEAHEPDPVNARLRALLARERFADERHGPVARLVERAREEAADAPSFRTPQDPGGDGAALRPGHARAAWPRRGASARGGRVRPAGRAVPGPSVARLPGRAGAVGGAARPGLPDRRRAARGPARAGRARPRAHMGAVRPGP
jgi:hypothetical protein